MPAIAPAAPRLIATRTHAFIVDLPLAEAFTLFEPLGEKRWARDWHPEFPVGTGVSETLSADTVFTVRRHSPDGAPVQTIWMITRYEPQAGAIEYRMTIPGVRVSRISIACRADSAARTAVQVTYRYTSLSDEGDRYVAEMTDDAFRGMIGEWDSEIRAWQKRGTPATP